jgi:hypothetical protein
MKLELYWQIFEKQTSVFTKNPPSGSRFDTRGRTDRHIEEALFAILQTRRNIIRVFEQHTYGTAQE